MNPLLMSILLIVALTVFGITMIRKIQLLRALEPADRINQSEGTTEKYGHSGHRPETPGRKSQEKEVRVLCMRSFFGDSVFY